MERGLLEVGRDVLCRQPFSVHMGAELRSLTPGHAEMAMTVSAELLQQHGFVHGGVLAYLADNALTFAAGSVLGDSVTVEVKINYLQPARDCERLVALATVVGGGKTQSVCRCDVFAEKEGTRVLCAAAQGTVRKVTREGGKERAAR